MKTIDRAALLAKTGVRYLDFVFEGEAYRIKSLTEAERAEYEIQLQGKKGYDYEKSRRLFLCKVLVDENNNRILTDADQEHLKAVDGRVIGMLYSQAQKHCGYDSDEIETLQKNSDPVAG